MQLKPSAGNGKDLLSVTEKMIVARALEDVKTLLKNFYCGVIGKFSPIALGGMTERTTTEIGAKCSKQTSWAADGYRNDIGPQDYTPRTFDKLDRIAQLVDIDIKNAFPAANTDEAKGAAYKSIETALGDIWQEIVKLSKDPTNNKGKIGEIVGEKIVGELAHQIDSLLDSYGEVTPSQMTDEQKEKLETLFEKLSTREEAESKVGEYGLLGNYARIILKLIKESFLKLCDSGDDRCTSQKRKTALKKAEKYEVEERAKAWSSKTQQDFCEGMLLRSSEDGNCKPFAYSAAMYAAAMLGDTGLKAEYVVDKRV
ncbi:unnamed protein product [Amoebophrya sp. A25]|nr:unnamed protein product [Amoebophrya sp. A25]|eukprot:GSA25T00025311001.1